MAANPRWMCVWITVGVGCGAPPSAPLEMSAGWEHPGGELGGVRRLRVEVDPPARLVLELEVAGTLRTLDFPAATAFDVPVVGLLPGELHTLHVRAEAADGRRARATLTTLGDDLPDDLPILEILQQDEARMPEGWWLLPVGSPGREGALDLLLDTQLRVVWWRRPEVAAGDLAPTAAGTLFGQGGGEAFEVAWTGEVLRQVGADLHHEARPLDDGSVLSLAYRSREVSGVKLESSAVVHLDADGGVVSEVDLLDVIDPARRSYGSDVPGTHFAGHLDHHHANAVVADDGGGRVVSLRHQDALIALDPDGALRWILGDPAGWEPPWSDALLAPVGAVQWPYHQHAPELGSDGRVLLFDNTNLDHTPYTEAPRVDRPSRVVELRVDEAARTVEELWSYTSAIDGPLHADAMGDADRVGDLVLGVWGWLVEEGGTPNPDRGWGQLTGRVELFDPDSGTAVFALRVRSDAAHRPQGWGLYRAHHVEALPGGSWGPSP